MWILNILFTFLARFKVFYSICTLFKINFSTYDFKIEFQMKKFLKILMKHNLFIGVNWFSNKFGSEIFCVI